MLDTNSPPVFTAETIAPDGSTLVLEQSENKIWVVVEDDQPELLSFYWVISQEELLPNWEYIEDDDESRQGAQVTLLPDPDYNGEELTCSVYDDGGNRASISWLLEVPE